MPILWCVDPSRQAYSASHQQSLHREILHAQEGIAVGGGPVTTSRRCTVAASIEDTILGVHIRSPEENGAPDAHLHAACD